ncbi:CGNR zinc finger domain-containing protein [Plantactinospora sp. B5E13]|uniref:CGNR zinc finger domain-containing protein n=1 Tax=unclassified Plantactinospora TaxID=2631981 RepID=UPI00325CD73D
MTPTAAGLTLRTPEGVAYLFDPGALCLEFLTTGGPGVLARYEVLHQPADLAEWLRLSRLRLDPATVHVSADQLRTAHRLRNALWRLGRDSARTGRRQADDLAEINQIARPAPLVPQATPDGDQTWLTPADGNAVLSTIARDAIRLFTGDLAGRIRECGSPDCYLIFVDTSRPGRRRWCAMEACGNRHKAGALRARRAASTHHRQARVEPPHNNFERAVKTSG